jgi:hypothetical protein
VRTLLYEAANCHADPLQGPAQTEGLSLRDREAINNAQRARFALAAFGACAGAFIDKLQVTEVKAADQPAPNRLEERVP